MTPSEIAALRLAAETPVQAEAGDLAACADDLAAAFLSYPMFDWFMRTDAVRGPALQRLFRLMLGVMASPAGTILRPAQGGAVAVWLPSDSLGPNPLLEELKALPTLIAATGWSRLGRLAALRTAMDAHHPMDRRHLYLWLLGVSPQVQGHGVGSRLLAAGLARADAQGLPAFLETSTEANVALYRRHGFEVIEHYLVRPDSPPTWTMWREPARA